MRTGTRTGTTREPVGPGRLLVVVYAFFAVAAGSRSAVQLATQGSEAPVAYALSAFAGLVYLAGTVALVRAERSPSARGPAAGLCLVELVGVLVVGTVSLVAPFPDTTAWSEYGMAYGFVPAVLPVLALVWLARPACRTESNACSV
jgi:hypothetical protein